MVLGDAGGPGGGARPAGGQAIYDAHVHLYSEDRARYPMVPGRERPLEPSASAEALIREMDAAGVAHALLVQTPWLGEDNRYLVESMHRHPGRFAAIGWLEDPLARGAPERLRRMYDEDGFRGVRLHLNDERVHAGVLAGAADPVFQWARVVGVPVQLLQRVAQHPAIVRVADRFRDVRVVVDHLGHPDVSEAPEYRSSGAFFSLAERPNVYVKVSMHNVHSREGYPWADLHGYQQRVFDAFGPRRLMWGSNWPMAVPQAGYREGLDAVREHLPVFAALSSDERAWVLGGTAQELWPVKW